MYTKRVAINLFVSDCPYTIYYKDGELYGYVFNNCPVLNAERASYPIELTRAQGYKYWKKHFPNRIVWSLPEALQTAIDRDPTSFGVFRDKNGELVGYEG